MLSSKQQLQIWLASKVVCSSVYSSSWIELMFPYNSDAEAATSIVFSVLSLAGGPAHTDFQWYMLTIGLAQLMLPYTCSAMHVRLTQRNKSTVPSIWV